ncbi:hypothetical protein HPP92_000179 [Vanilla planifolia]|uniref:Uncharacterized protein n=1 Tax=Vanilla planifolia TaxID=51239 RepID=A0A835VFP9_VANPL|nr:hypothetical protein HPP92_000179 [Vanilla planifolia]
MRKRLRNLYAKEAVEFLNHVMEEKPLLPFLIPLGFFAWAIERWLVPFSNWIPLAFAVWATIEYGRFRRQLLMESMNKRWKQLIVHTMPVTPFEPCEWLNKLLMEVWPNYMEPRLSHRLSSMVERRLKNRKPKLIEKLELQEFSLGSCPPNLGEHGYIGLLQSVMRLGFDWDSNEMSVMLMAKLAKPLMGTARIVINSIHIKGDILVTPILDGQALLYSFESTPEIRIGVAFGSGNSQALPATELPGVSTWLVKIFMETLAKTMVEPRRACFSLPAIDHRKKAVGGVLSVSVVSASNVHELELGDLTRKTNTALGSNPRWNAAFNMIMHGDTGILRFHLYESDPTSVKLNYLTSCEIKTKYVSDDSTTFWAIGPKLGVVAKHAENCGQEIEMVIPFEETNFGEVLQRTKTVYDTTTPVWNQVFEFDEIIGGEYLKINCFNAEKFGDEKIGSARVNLEGLLEGSCRDAWIPLEKVNSGELRLQIKVAKSNGRNSPPRSFSAGWIELFLIEARDLVAADLRGTSDPYVKVQYGNVKKRTKVVYKTLYPRWYQYLEFPDTGSRLVLYVKDHNAVLPESSIGDCVVEYEMLPPNETADKWIPLQGVKSGEIHVHVTRRVPDLQKKSKVSSSISSSSKATKLTGNMREMLKKVQGLVNEGDLEGLSLAISEMESAEDAREEYLLLLEREKALLVNKISDLGHEILRSSSSPSSLSF